MTWRISSSSTTRTPWGPLVGLCAALSCVAACGAKVTTPGVEASTGDSAGASGPDLGSDVVVCGEPGDYASLPEEYARLAGCEVYLGGLQVPREDEDRSALSSLRVVNEGLVGGGYNLRIETLDGFERLESVGRFHFLSDGLRDLSGVRNLREVKNHLRLDGMPNLTSLHGLEQLRVVGKLSMSGNQELTSLAGLAGLEKVEGDLTITHNPQVPRAEVEELLSRIEVGGTVITD